MNVEETGPIFFTKLKGKAYYVRFEIMIYVSLSYGFTLPANPQSSVAYLSVSLSRLSVSAISRLGTRIGIL